MDEHETHMCICWLGEPCAILDNGKIEEDDENKRISSIVGYITACGIKLYRSEVYLMDYITDCRKSFGGYGSRVTVGRHPVTCPECRLLGSLE